jgi:hypothetical protein
MCCLGLLLGLLWISTKTGSYVIKHNISVTFRLYFVVTLTVTNKQTDQIVEYEVSYHDLILETKPYGCLFEILPRRIRNVQL